MKKIAIVGGHGVGKTTLCNALKKCVEEKGQRAMIIGEIIRDCPYPINDGMCLNTALWTASRQIELELSAEMDKTIDYVICDRSVYDPMLYLKDSLHRSVDEFFLVIERILHNLCFNLLETYHKIVLVHGFNPKNLLNDGIRSQDIYFGYRMDDVFLDAFDASADYLESNAIFNEIDLEDACQRILS